MYFHPFQNRFCGETAQANLGCVGAGARHDDRRTSVGWGQSHGVRSVEICFAVLRPKHVRTALRPISECSGLLSSPPTDFAHRTSQLHAIGIAMSAAAFAICAACAGQDAGNQWTLELCQRDSDGDGQTNGEELGDPDCIWKPGARAAAHVPFRRPNFGVAR